MQIVARGWPVPSRGLAMMMGLREIRALKRRFQALNRDRLERTRNSLRGKQMGFLDLLPLIFHVNHPLLPGYVSKETPAGISDYSPSARAVKVATKMSKSFSVNISVSSSRKERSARSGRFTNSLYLFVFFVLSDACIILTFEHSQSTVYQYQMAWEALTDYFIDKHDQVMFSKQLAEQYILESKAKLKAGAIKKWRYKLDRLTVLMLIECNEYGHVTWKYHNDDNPTRLLQSAYMLLHKDYLNCLEKEGKGAGTIRIYEIVSRQFFFRPWMSYPRKRTRPLPL